MQSRQPLPSHPIARQVSRVSDIDVEHVITPDEVIHEARDVLKRIRKKSHHDPVHLLIDRFRDQAIRDVLSFRLLRRTDLSDVIRTMIQKITIIDGDGRVELTKEYQDFFDRFTYTVRQVQDQAIDYLEPHVPIEISRLKQYIEGDQQVVNDLPLSEPFCENGRIYVQKRYRRSHTEVFLPPYTDAVRYIRSIPADIHVLGIRSCDVSDGMTIEQWEALVTIRDVLAKKRYWITAYLTGSDMLRAFRDAMCGAAHLADHGLVLQDINLNNIGIALSDGRGVLFDLEGLAVAGTVINGRLADKRYFPPEVRKTEDRKRFTCPIAPAEMMFQFGKSLEIFVRHCDIGLPIMVGTVLEALADRMVVEEPADRPSFREIIHRLDELITVTGLSPNRLFKRNFKIVSQNF